MFRKMVSAVFVLTVTIGLVTADEFNALVTKVDGNNVSFYRITKGKKDGDLTTLPANDAKVNKGTQKGKKFTAGDPIDGGLKNEIFTSIGAKGLLLRMITDDDNKKITQILILKPGGK